MRRSSLAGCVAAAIAVATCVVPVRVALARHGKGGGSGSSRREREPRGPPWLRLDEVSVGQARAVVRVGGIGRPPDARRFVFHDERQRHFVALAAACTEGRKGGGDGAGSGGEAGAMAPGAVAPSAVAAGAVAASADDGEPAFRCTLELPRPYLRARVLALTVRIRGKEVAAEEREVQARFDAARAAPGPGMDDLAAEPRAASIEGGPAGQAGAIHPAYPAVPRDPADPAFPGYRPGGQPHEERKTERLARPPALRGTRTPSRADEGELSDPGSADRSSD